MKTDKKLMQRREDEWEELTRQREDEWKKWYRSNSSTYRGQELNTKEAWLEGARRERERILCPPNISKKTKEIKKIKLGFKADVPTVNGRIYTRSVLEEAFKRIKENADIFIVEDSTDVVHNYMVPIKKVIGVCKNYEILENGDVFIYAKPINNFPYLDAFKLLTHGYANINRDNYVENFRITCFYLQGPDNYLAGD